MAKEWSNDATRELWEEWDGNGGRMIWETRRKVSGYTVRERGESIREWRTDG